MSIGVHFGWYNKGNLGITTETHERYTSQVAELQACLDALKEMDFIRRFWEEVSGEMAPWASLVDFFKLDSALLLRDVSE